MTAAFIDEPGLTLPQRHGVRCGHGFERGPTVRFGIVTVGEIAPGLHVEPLADFSRDPGLPARYPAA